MTTSMLAGGGNPYRDAFRNSYQQVCWTFDYCKKHPSGGFVNTQQMITIVEQYCRNSAVEHLGMKITPIARQKTVFVEQSGESGRAIMLSEYKVDGATYWAGYSTHTKTIYISAAA